MKLSYNVTQKRNIEMTNLIFILLYSNCKMFDLLLSILVNSLLYLNEFHQSLFLEDNANYNISVQQLLFVHKLLKINGLHYIVYDSIPF